MSVMAGDGKPAAPTGMLRVTLLYLLLTLAMTWPLAAGIARDVPGDLGDPLLNMWILGWGTEHLPDVVAGRMTLHDFWNANIFHPAPLALGFSEHLAGQVLQILPVYYLTGNLILVYNLLFLSSFVLSGLGMYLLVRDLIGDDARFSWPAFVAGLIFAFVPFRIAQVSHIQSVSSQWMPLALYGFRRFILHSGSTPPPTIVSGPGPMASLILGTGSLLMQNLSCGYYLMFFAPCAALFIVHQVMTSGRWREWRLWGALASAAVVVIGGTWPFLALYLEMQRVHSFERPLGEVLLYSADVYSYLTAPEALWIWGPLLQVFPKREGELFFGVIPWALFFVAALSLARLKPGPTTLVGTKVVGPGFRLAERGLGFVLLVQLVGLLALVLTGGFVTSFAGIPIRATNAGRLVIGISIVSALLLAVSAPARARVWTALRSPLTFAIVLTVLAIWLSLGPRPHSFGRPLDGLGLYGVLYENVPGFDGLRVPARYAMIAALFIAIAAGYGVAVLERFVNRRGRVAIVLAAVFLAEAFFAPMTMNATSSDVGVSPPARVEPAADALPVYRQLAAMPDVQAVAEFPFGDPAWELRYVYYATVHWKRLVNGHSGGFPRSYSVRAALLARLSVDPEAAWRALRDAGTSHVIVHRSGFANGQSQNVEDWLIAHGARLGEAFGDDRLYVLPAASP
jgi:hypothetical protein